MSNPRRVVGLSDTQFDSDLHNDEIDHLFFDNPCIGIASEVKALETGRVTTGSLGHVEFDKRLLVLIPDPLPSQISDIPINGLNGTAPSTNKENSIPLLSINQPDSLSLIKATAYIDDDDLQTPDTDTCVSSPNLEYSNGQNQMFSTGKLLECLTQPNDLQGWVNLKFNDPQPMRRGANVAMDLQSLGSSGPNSSYLNLAFKKYQESGERCKEGFTSQDPQLPTDSMRMKLFDVSSSSSDGSDSDSDPGSLDTEDEAFVDLLEKYYDYIDLGESDYSDITEVSPMSSLTASPLPPFNGLNNLEENTNLSLKHEESSSPGHELSLSAAARMMPMNRQGHNIIKPKPLPPLIIHTIEEVPGTNAHSNTMYWPDNFEDLLPSTASSSSQARDQKKGSLSLLMTADLTENKIISEGENDASGFRPSGSSSVSIPSRGSYRSSASSACSRSNSSSMGSSLTVSKRQVKNHSFTPDQMRRIEKDNTVLLRKILDTNKGHHGHRWGHGKGALHHHKGGHHASIKASATIARQRQQRRIEHENSILIRRLQNAKPSKEIVEAFGATNNNVKCT